MIFAIILVLFSPIAAGAAESLAAKADQAYPALFELYKDLHSHPELSFQEKETSARVAGELRKLGLEVTEGLGGNGFVGVLKNGPGPVIMLRADLDALPVEEKTGLAYASKVQAKTPDGRSVFVAHACGHDVHMTVLIGAARLLSGIKDRWKGTLLFVGQPAEERAGGARAMLADGLFTRFPRPNFNLALHVSAELPAGQIGYVEGYGWAYVNMIDVTVRGRGGHGAFPHKTKDPVVLAAQIVLALQTIVSREISPLDSAVVTVGSIHGGTKHNIIPDEVKLQITVRALSDDIQKHLIESIRRICRGTALAAGIAEDNLPIVTVSDEETPSIYNEPELTRRLVKTFKGVFGEKRVVATRPSMGGDDFAYYGRVEPAIPSAYIWLGAVDPALVAKATLEAPLPSLHSAQFAPLPEPTIKTGVEALATAILELAEK